MRKRLWTTGMAGLVISWLLIAVAAGFAHAAAPTDITLSGSSVAENRPIGTIVGSLSSADTDVGDTFTYTLVAGDAWFSIVGSSLVTDLSFDFEAQATYTIRVRSTDAPGGELFEKDFTVTITDVNEAPSALVLSNDTVAENLPVGTAVGVFTTTDPDAGDTFTYTLVPGVGSDNNAQFTIAGDTLVTDVVFNFEAKSTYLVRIRSTDSGGEFVEDDYTIAIVDVDYEPVDVRSPDGGEFWTAGSTHDIVWESGEGIDTDVRIDLYKGGVFNAPIVGTTANDGTFSWTIPIGQQTGADYTVRITSVGDPTIFDESFAPFEIAYYVPTVFSPNGGELWQGGEAHDITWDTEESDGANVTIELFKAGGVAAVITSNITNTGSFTWVIPPTIVSGADYKIRVSSVGNAAIFDFSDNDFSIMQNALRVVSPNGAEKWAAGSTHPITWSNEGGIAGNLRIDLYKGGLLNSPVVVSTAVAGGSYSWTIPAAQAPGTDYRVRITSIDDPSVFAVSFGDFEIAKSAPSDIVLNNTSVLETAIVGTKVGTLSTTDADPGDTFTYTLVDGSGSADNASFSIVGSELRTAVLFDFALQSSFSIRVRSTDLAGLFTEKPFTITLRDANAAPTNIALGAATVAENVPLSTLVGALSTTDADAGDAFTYALVSGAGSADNGSFAISGSDLITAAAFDFETQSSYTIRVQSTDQGGLGTAKAFAITVTNVNEAPTDVTLTAATVPEGSAAATAIGTFGSVDQDAGDTFTYTLVGGTGSLDNASFTIGPGGVLQTAAVFNFDVKSSYSIRVRSTDSGALWAEQVFTVTVTDVTQSPSDIALSNDSVNENAPAATLVGTLSTTDPDVGDTVFTYSLVPVPGNTDNASFAISGADLVTAAVLNFEAKASYQIRIRTTDPGGKFFEEPFTITVNDLTENAAPTDLTLTGTTVPENAPVTTKVGTLSTTDTPGDTFTYTLVGGTGSADNGKFSTFASDLITATALNFEAQTTYFIRVRTTDQGGLSFEKEFTVTATNVNEAPTDIVLVGTTVAESLPAGTPVGTLSSADPDTGNTFAYTLVDGTGSDDNASFQIAGSQLQTAAVLSFGVDNSYSIRVRTTDGGGLFFEEVFTVTVIGVQDAIMLSSPNGGETWQAGSIHTISWTSEGSVGASVRIDLYKGTLLNQQITLLTPNDGSYSWTISGAQQSGADYKVRVTSLTNPALFGSSFNTFEITPNLTTDITLTANNVNRDDPISTTVGTLNTLPGADTYTYTLVDGTGSTDNNKFKIVGDALQTNIPFTAVPGATCSIRVRSTSSGGTSIEKAFTINVIDVNLAPTQLTLTGNTVVENRPAGTKIGTFSTTDPNPGDSFTYDLRDAVAGCAGPDNASFSIAGADLETAALLTPLGTRTLCACTTDLGGLDRCRSFTITITPNHAPVLDAIGDQLATEGEEFRIDLNATDQDGDLLTYDCAPLPAGATFDGQSLIWTNPVAGAYGVTCSVSDGFLGDAEAVTITVELFSPLAFFDDFSDGNASGDPEWVKISGGWTVNSGDRYVATSRTRPNISVVRQDLSGLVATGRIETLVRMNDLGSATAPNAMLIFSYVSPQHYRFVKLVKGGIRIGQVEPFGLSNAKLASSTVAARVGRYYPLSIDMYDDGHVVVFLSGNPVLGWTFPSARPGLVGVGSTRNGAVFDNFGISDESVLP